MTIIRLPLSKLSMGFLALLVVAATSATSAERTERPGLTSPSRSIPRGIPNPDFWWALPTLLKTGYPVILPRWLPTQGRAGATFNPEQFGGLPPITIALLQGNRKAGRLPGYSIGIGYVGSDGAVPILVNTHRAFAPRIVPNTLTSQWTYSTDGRDSPPIGIQVTKPPDQFRPLGLPVHLKDGIVAHVSTDVSGGTMGDTVTVSFRYGAYLVQVTYPGIDRRTPLRIAASLVQVVKLPTSLDASFDTHQLTLTPTTASPLSYDPSKSQAWGYRYQIRTISRQSHLTTSPAMPTVPSTVPVLPPLPCFTVLLEISQPSYVVQGVALPARSATSPFLSKAPVLLPQWLPASPESGLLGQVMAWKTEQGYYVGFLTGRSGPVFYGWAPKGEQPPLIDPRTVRLVGGKIGRLGRTPTGWQLNIPLAPHIMGYLSGAVPPSQLLRATKNEIYPGISISSQPGKERLPGGHSLPMPWGIGRVRVGRGQVQIVGWAYHQTYTITVRGSQRRLREAEKIAKSLTWVD